MKIGKKQLNTIHERDLDRLLERLNIKERFENGKIKCKFCDTPITKDNLYSLLPESGTAHLVCDRRDCILKIISYISEKTKKVKG